MLKSKNPKKKIMVVDDESDQILSVKQIFEYDDEYEIVTAKNGMECLKLLYDDINPNLILLDVMMPKMNGLEVFKRIRENKKWNHIPVIIITAMGGKEKITDEEISPDDYIEKPYDVVDLKKRVKHFLN